MCIQGYTDNLSIETDEKRGGAEPMLEARDGCESGYVEGCFVVGSVEICTDLKSPSVDMDMRRFILLTTASDFLAYGGTILK